MACHCPTVSQVAGGNLEHPVVARAELLPDCPVLCRGGRVTVDVATETVKVYADARYAIDGPLESPDGRNPLVRTVWMLEKGSTAPRLITAYPLEERR